MSDTGTTHFLPISCMKYTIWTHFIVILGVIFWTKTVLVTMSENL